VERWYDSSHTVDDLAEWFETLYECAGAVDVPIKPSYENAYETLTESPEEVKLSAFIDDVEQFQNMEDTTGMTLIARLHDFARSQHEQDAWDIYEAFDSLIEDLQEKTMRPVRILNTVSNSSASTATTSRSARKFSP